MNVTIEISQDPSEIVDLCRQVHEEHRQRRSGWFKPLGRAEALRGLCSLLSHDGTRLFVARVEGACVGYALVRYRVREENPFRYASRSLMIEQMAVSSVHRRQGIGTLMMRRIRVEATRRGAQRVELRVYSDNDAARRFYEEQGFARLHDIMESSL